MSGQERDATLCLRVLERLVDERTSGTSGTSGASGLFAGAGVGEDPLLAEHLGSCVTCFRTLTELRDAPRVAEVLRGAVAPREAGPSDRFWEELAVRTTVAAGAALRASGSVVEAPASARRGHRWSIFSRGRTVLVATALAAAAVFAVVAQRPPVVISTRASGQRATGGVAPTVSSLTRSSESSSASSGSMNETGEEAADVAELDGTALRRLLDRLRTRAPGVLTSFGAGDSGEASDSSGDEDRRVNDELANLDGTALRRVAGSLSVSSL